MSFLTLAVWLPVLLANLVAFFQFLSFIMSSTLLVTVIPLQLAILIHSFLRAAFVSATLPGIEDSMGKDARFLFLWILFLINILFFLLLSCRCTLILNIQTLFNHPFFFFFSVHFFAKVRNRWADQTNLMTSAYSFARVQVATNCHCKLGIFTVILLLCHSVLPQ